MVLVNSLSCVDTPEDGNGNEELKDSNQCLKYNNGYGYQTQDSVWGDKMRVRTLVDLDDGEAG